MTITNFTNGVDVAEALEKIESGIEQAGQGGVLIETKMDLEVAVMEWDAAASDYANKLLERIQDVPEVEDLGFEIDDDLDYINNPNGMDGLVYDDLTQLKHVGEVTQQRMNVDGVRTFADVARLEPSDLTKYPRVSYDDAEQIIAEAKKIIKDE